MINTSKGDALTQAFELIEAEKLEDARAILKPVLDTDRDNADAWWLYAHAVTDSETARVALNNVLRIDSDYPEAADLLKSLEEKSPSDHLMESDREPSFLPAVPASLPDLPEGDDFPSDVDETDDFDDEADSESFFKRPVFLIGVIALLLIVALVIVIVRPFGSGTPDTTSLATVEQPTLPATIAVSDITQAAPTLESEAVADAYADLKTALAAFTLTDDGVSTSNSALGNTLMVSVCTHAGREMRALLPEVMDTLAKASNSYTGQEEAVAVRMMDCDVQTPLLTIGASLSDVQAYNSGSLSEQDFQSRWKPIQ